MKHLKNQLFK